MRLLLLITLLHFVVFATGFVRTFLERDGLLVSPHAPFGGDFVNLWTVGKLVLSGAADSVYRHESFMEFQRTLVPQDIGLRLWAYPPHSLLFVWPFGLAGYFAMFAVWSVLGLGVLAAGARRIGFNSVETAILTFSPASLQCIYYGQTGNLACGLMLFALAGSSLRTPSSIAAAALLTVKPQTGFLLPILWLLRRRWSLLLATSAATLFLVVLSVLFFGAESWKDYVADTLPTLSGLERGGTGPFLYMIPSLFISLRLVGFEGHSALFVHLAFAGLVAMLLVWWLARSRDSIRQAALILIAGCLITPYLHVYDLGLLLAGAMLALRGPDDLAWPRHVLMLAAVLLAWLLPKLVIPLGLIGLPLSPAIIAAIFVIAHVATSRRALPTAQRPAPA
jgi:alpha-1,2-mannosyltransferase